MNILASYNWIKEYLKTEATPEEFARELSLRGPGVEKIISLGDSFHKIVVGKLLSVDAHPNADKLRVCKVDVGAKSSQQIVCGGSNLAVGQLVAVALPGSRVRWHGQGDLVTLASAELRGVKSEGMICASDEIGLGDLFPSKDKEVMDLSATKSKPGTSVADACGLESPIFDIEATTNRPDCFAIAGLALEASASGLGKYVWNEVPFQKSKTKDRTGLRLEVKDTKLCPRYTARVMRGIKVGPSPMWMQARLFQAGIRPINNIVDITNYVMLEIGHPLHAFDRAKVNGDVIKVRKAKEGENFLALDGKTYSLKSSDLVIANKDEVMALAGVMGGEVSGISQDTVSIVLEAANFEPITIRKSSRSHALITDSSLRFEKGLSSREIDIAFTRAQQLILDLVPGSEVLDLIQEYKEQKLQVHGYRPDYAESLIGENIPAQKQKKILESLGFGVSSKGKKWAVTVPYWREHDIEGERDLVEEVARVYGYHKIKPVMPAGFGAAVTGRSAQGFFWEDEVKRFMEATGWTELMTYTYTNAAAYAPVGRPISNLLAVSNPLSSDFTHLRDMLLPNMLTVVCENQERFPRENVYELGTVYTQLKPGALPDEGLRYLALSYGHSDEAFSEVKGLLETISAKFGFSYQLMPTEQPQNFALHPGRSAVIMINGEMCGVLGELAPEVLSKAGITKRAGMLTFKFDSLVKHLSSAKAFKGIPEFPSVLRDVSFIVGEKVTHADLVKAFSGIDAQVCGAERFDEYRGKEIGAGKKSLAYHLEFRSAAGTLTTEQADALTEKIRAVLKSKFQADVRS